MRNTRVTKNMAQRVKFTRKGTPQQGGRTFSGKRRKVTFAQRQRTNILRQEAAILRAGTNVRTGGFQGLELKFYDTSLVGAVLTANTDGSGGEHDPSATVKLNTVVRGTSESNRIGNKIQMKNISLNGIVTIPVAANITTTDIRPIVFIALVLDHQTNGATLSSEDVYVNQGANAVLGTSMYRNLQTSKRYRVLRSMQVVPDQPTLVFDATNIEQGGLHTPWRMDVPMNTETQFNGGTTADVANIEGNSLHIVAWASSTSYIPTFSYNARLRFVG